MERLAERIGKMKPGGGGRLDAVGLAAYDARQASVKNGGYMIKEYQSKSNWGIAPGLLGEIVGSLMERGGHADIPLGAAIVFCGGVLFIWGCAQYAKAKGFSGWFGLFGILGLIGLLVLAFFPDRHKAARA